MAIVGAGAAGLATAIFARRLNPSLSVVVLDGAKKPGAKILVSGGSRCNITNTVVAEADFWGGRRTIIRRVLRALPVDETIAFFRGIGVALHEEADGKLFPDSNRSRDVLDALLRELNASGARLLADHRVLDVDRITGRFTVHTSRGPIESRAVVLATGGRSLPKSGSDGAGYAIAQRLGHTIVPTTPALAPLLLADGTGLHRELSGVSHEAEIAIRAESKAAMRLRGSLLWTHFGISGPLALNASRHWARATLEGREAVATLSFVPGRQFDDVDRAFVSAASDRPRASVQSALASSFPHLPASVVAAVIERSAIDRELPISHLPREERRRLAHALVEWTLHVAGTRGYNYAEATAGGVDLAEIDPATMESRRCAGLFLVGEILDVDGRIGGFNFQWAWSSARAAARGLVLFSASHYARNV